jgi:hypothetical protein
MSRCSEPTMRSASGESAAPSVNTRRTSKHPALAPPARTSTTGGAPGPPYSGPLAADDRCRTPRARGCPRPGCAPPLYSSATPLALGEAIGRYAATCSWSPWGVNDLDVALRAWVRRMVDTAAHLMQQVLPAVPIRHWIGSLPWGQVRPGSVLSIAKTLSRSRWLIF